MDTPLLARLRLHLANINAEQFQSEWSEIEALGFEGMPVEVFLKTLFTPPAISPLKSPEYSPSFTNDNYSSNIVPGSTYANAA